MTQIFTGTGLGTHGSSLGQLGSYGPKGSASLGNGGDSVYVNGANGNLVIKQSDGFLSDVGMGMDVFQTYNSKGEKANSWCFNIETRLVFEGKPNTEGSIVTRIDEDGHLSRFKYDSIQKAYIAEDGSIAKITYNNGDWQYLEGSGETRYHYNNKGQLTGLSDKDGHRISISYENGQVSRITDNSSKQSITWTFSQGRLSDVTFVSDGKTVHHLHYEYDSQNRLVKVSRDLGDGKTYWIRYAYAGNSNLISDISQSDGTKLHIDYDSEGRVKQLIDGEGRVTKYNYLSGKTIVTNGLGESWTYFYDNEARLTGIDGPEHYQIRYYYEGKRLAKVTQGKQIWSFKYNDAGDCIRIEGPSGEMVQRTYDKEHRIQTETRYQRFDGDHHPIKPHTTRYVYDEQGHLRFEVKSDGTVTEYRYNQDGLRLSTRCYLRTHFDTASLDDNQPLSLEVITQWSEKQNQQAISLTSYSYDWRGNLCEELRYTLIDEQGNGVLTKDTLKSYCQYDAAGRLIEKSTITDTGLATTQYLYDALGRLIRTIDNQKHSTSIEYDDEHQRIIKTDANGLQTISIYDRSGLLLYTQRLDQSHDFGRTIYRYDAASRLISETDVSGRTHYYLYDAQGRLAARVTPGGQISEYQYDAEGHCIKTRVYEKHIDTRGFQDHLPDWNSIKPKTSSQDRISQVVYNDLNQIAYQINADGAVIGYQYDAEGRVIGKTAYANRLTDYAKTLSFKDVIIQISPKDRTVTYYYNAEGWLEGEVNGEGAVTGYFYDTEGRLIEKRLFSDPVKTPQTGDWKLDRPINHGSDIRTFSLYNVAGFKIADLNADGYLTEYRYDSRGLLIDTISYYNEVVYVDAPDEQTSLETLRPKAHANDHHKSYRYNDLDQLIEEKTQSGLITTYTYNESGQVVTKTQTDRKTQEARKQQYRYDTLGRIVQSLDALGSLKLEKAGHLNQDEIEIIWQQHSIRYQYDNAGLLLSKTNALNQTTRYFYNEKGLLTFTLNAEGAVTETRYNGFSQVEASIRYHALWKAKGDINIEQLKQYIDVFADQRFDEVTHYEYDNLGNIISKRSGSGNKMTTTYNAFGEIEQTIQHLAPNNQTITTYQYNLAGLLRFRTNDSGVINQTSELRYDAFGRIAYGLDGLKRKTSYAYNNRGELILLENPGHAQKIMSYDAYGRLLDINDKKIEEYTYDDVNNTLTIRREGIAPKMVTEFNAFGDKITYTDGNHNKTIFQYDAKGQLIHIDGPEHNASNYQYDAEGQLILEEKDKHHKIRYTYNAEGQVLTKSIDPEGLNICTTFTYDGIGRQLTINDAGRTTQFTYDNQGNLIKKCLDPDGLNLITEFSYTETGQLARQTTYNTKGTNQVTSYEWDALGRCISTTVDPDGLRLTTLYEYDNNNNLIFKTDAKLQRTQFLYDDNNQLRYQIDPRGVVAEHVYSIKGSEIRTIIYANRIDTSISYDEKSIHLSLRPDNLADQYQFFVYDRQSRLLESYDSLGYPTAYTYDANDNVIKKIRYAIPYSLIELKSGKFPILQSNGSTRITHFVYDGLNQQRYQIESSGRIAEYRYDSMGQVIQQTRYAKPFPLKETGGDLSISQIQNKLRIDETQDRTTYSAYDAAGRLKAQTNPSGAVTGFDYDDAGNLIATTRYATLLTNDVLKSDNWSTRLLRSKNDRTTRAVFDAAGREVYRVSATGKVVSREYDAAGNIITERVYAKTFSLTTYSFDEINAALNDDRLKAQLTTYDYDATGRLLVKTDALKHTTQYTYDADNNVTSKTEANKAIWTYRYDECNQLIETSSPQIRVSRYQNGKLVEELRSIKTQNSYDSFGNVIASIRDAEGVKQTTLYTYNANNQKTATIYPDVRINKAGPAASAERQEEAKTLSEMIAYNAFGEVISTTDKAGHKRHWAYDLNGNMRYSIDAKNGLVQYDYDAFDTVQKKTSYAKPIVLAADSDYSIDTISEVTQTNERDRTETYTYDKEGRLVQTCKDALISYNSKTGQYHNLSPTKKINYNAFGEVIQTEVQLNDTDWATTHFYYDAEGLKTAQIDAEGYLTRYTYNDYCLLDSEIQYAGRCKQWTVDEYKEPEAHSKDRTVTFTYDAAGQLISKTLKAVTYQKLTGVGSKYENVTGDLTSSYSYDALGNLVRTTDALGHTVYSYYNEIGQLTAKVGAATQAGRSATTYTYDALGQLVETHQWANGAKYADETHFTLAGESRLDIISSEAYDSQGHLMKQIDGTGHEINYSYDANGNITRTWQVLNRVGKSAIIQDKRYTFDAENHLTQTATIKANGTYATDDAQYNAFGEVIAKGLNSKFTTHIDYDLTGRVWRSNLQGYYQIYIYDLADHVTQVVTSTNTFGENNDEKGVDLSRSEYEKAINYNADNFMFDIQRQDNIYDSLGRLLTQTKDGSTSIKDKNNKTVNKKATQVNTLDRWGNVTSHTNANHYTTYYEYNAFDEVSKQILPEVKVVDEKGIAKMISPEIYFAYDALGRVIAMTDANKHTVAKVLDAEGHVLQEIDARGNQRGKRYDLLGQLTSTTTKRDSTILTINYTYDKANRLLSVSTPNTTQTYAYDGAGQLIVQSDRLNNAIYYEYDELGHQVERKQRGHTTAMSYDDAGHKLTERDAKGNTQTWVYNDNGNLIEHTDLGKHKTVYTYNVNGLMLTERSVNGTKSKSFHYFSDGQLEQYVDNSKGEVVNFTYDDEGNVRSKESSSINAWIVETDHYDYDALGRLSQVRRRNPKDTDSRYPDADKSLLSIDYEYDAVGNIRDTKVMTRYPNHKAVNQNDYYLYDENNRVVLSKGQLLNGTIQITQNQGSVIGYDETGAINSAKKYEGGALHQYTYHYNTDNFLNLIKKDGHNLQAKQYDAAGNVQVEYRYNNLGNVTQKNIMGYENGLLKSINTQDGTGKETSATGYQYDCVGNIEKVTTGVQAQGSSSAYTETHTYAYALWDSYQQQYDDATRSSATGTQTGTSERKYDANGQLTASVDAVANPNTPNNTTYYLNSSLDGIRARMNKDGQTSYLTVAGKTIGDLKLDKNGDTHLEVYGGFTPSGTPEQANTMMPGLWQKMKTAADSFKLSNATDATPPEAPQDSLGSYTLQSGDTLQSIALQVYGDASLWYLIADANGITNSNARAGEQGSALHIGQRLNIPPAAQSQHHTHLTHKVLNGNDIIGNTTATIAQPPAPPPPPKKHHGVWRVIGRIAVAVIATIATVYTAGAIGAALGGAGGAGGFGALLGLGTTVLGGGGGIALAGSTLLGTIGAGFAAGFVGSVAGQSAAALLGLQKGIDFKGALITGLATAATAGVGRALSSNVNYQNFMHSMDKAPSLFNIQAASEMMERDVLSQGINMTARRQQHLDWLEIGISSATAGFIGSDTGKKFNQTMEKGFKKVAPTITSEAQSLATGALTSAAKGTHFNAGHALVDNFGNALGNNIVQHYATIGATAAKESAIEAAKREMAEAKEKKNLDQHMQTQKNIKAEQSKGAWSDDSIMKELSLTSTEIDLLEPWNKEEKFDMQAYWNAGKNAIQIKDSPLTAREDGYGELYGSRTLAFIENISTVGEGALRLRASNVGKYNIDYDALLIKKPGYGYKKSEIKSKSHYYESPGSPIWGDASRELQLESIDALIDSSLKHGLNSRDTAHVLAIAQHESGFNPYAAAGSTTATGLGQFVDGTGLGYEINSSTRWDIVKQSNALVRHFIDNRAICRVKELPEPYIYKFHHDGPKYDYGGLALSHRFIVPKIGVLQNAINEIF